MTIGAGNGSLTTQAGVTLAAQGDIGGTGGLVKNGAGTLVLSGDNSYAGGTTLNGGSVQISRDSNLGDASGAVTFNGGDLTATQSMSTQRAMTIGAGNGSLTTQAG
ncbi:autotransporter-associated beta strand repeat-containing protein, partial [Dyella sp. ASV21]|uniref:autotransporter-associated beta strand repeat-containing protein n=1 Tax=Dyella sp. ASV21 TaxID=2795114 RepID=UPI0018EB776F